MNAPENNLQIDVLLPELSHLPQKATIEELKNWIKEGKLRPTHQIRVKNLPWVEAQNIPVLKPLFETKEKEDKDRLIDSYNQFSLQAPAFDYLKNRALESAKVSSKPKISSADLMAKELEEAPEKKEKKIATPSIAFKLYEKKVLARTQQTDSEAVETEEVELQTGAGKNARKSTDNSKKSVYLKRVFVYLAGCCLMFLLAYGGAYVWVYHLKTPVEINENNFPELMNLTHKLTAEKLDLRLKAAEKEKEMKAVSGQIAPPTDLTPEIVKLENQFKNRRTNLIEQHRSKVQTDDFNSSYYFSFAVLLSLFLITNVFVGKRVTEGDVKSSPKKPKTKSSEISEFSDLGEELGFSTEKDEFSAEKPAKNETNEAVEIENPKSETVQSAKPTNSSADGINTTGENSEAAGAVKTVKCLLHQEKSAAFNCEKCANNFCADCVVVIEEQEKCCPFCKIVCAAFAAQTAETTAAGSTKKKKTLFDLSNKDNGKRISRERRTNKVGVVPALVIALLFSCAISIFWVYKLTPYLENRGNETAQKTSNDQNNAPETVAPSKTQTAESGGLNSNTNTAKEPCIDPQTRQPFECDDETRNALRDHTEKVKSVEKAQKDTKEKTESILGLIFPNSASTTENTNPADEARKEAQKQQLIKVFIISFGSIFGLLMAVRIFSSEKNEETEEAEETDEDVESLS